MHMETQEGDRKNAILRGFEKRILFQRPLSCPPPCPALRALIGPRSHSRGQGGPPRFRPCPFGAPTLPILGNLNHFPLPNLGLPQKNTTFALPHYALVVEW